MAKNTTQAEVVVTLNGQAARNELNRIEKEMQQYRDAAEEAYRAGNKALGDQMTKNAQRLEKEFKVAKKDMKDFSDTVKNMGTKSIKELESAAKGLEKQLKTLSRKDPSWDQKKKQYQQVTRQLKEMKAEYKGVNAEQEKSGQGLGKLTSALGKYSAYIAAAMAAMKAIIYVAKETINASQTMGDAWNNSITAMKTTTQAFWAALSTGDWTVFNDGIDAALKRAKELAEIMDLIGSYNISKKYMQSKYMVEYQQAMTQARNKNLPEEQRQEWFKVAEDRLREYNDFLADEGEKNKEALRKSFETLKGLTFDSQEEFEAFFDMLYKNAFVQRDAEFEKAKKDFQEWKEQFKNEEISKNTTPTNATLPSGSDDAIGAAIDNLFTLLESKASATDLAYEEVEKQYGHMIRQLIAATEITDDEHIKLLNLYDEHQKSLQQVAKSERQLNEVRAQLKVDAGEYAKAVKEIDEEETNAMRDTKKRYAEGLIDKNTYEKETSRIGAEAREKRKQANQRYLNEDLKAITKNEQTKINETKKEYEQGKISYEEYQETLTKITIAANEEREDIIKFYNEELRKIEDKDWEERIKERDRRLQAWNQAYSNAQDRVSKSEQERINFWKKQYAAGIIDKTAYETRIAMTEEEYLQRRMATAQKYGKDTDQYMSQLLDRQIARLEWAKKQMKEEADEMQKYYENLQAGDAARFGSSSQSIDDKANEQFWGEIAQKAADIRAQITDESARQEYETKVAWAEKLAEKEILTNKEAQKYILQAKIDYAAKAASQVNSILAEAANFVSALQDAELAQLDADYQKQLTMAGDNAEKREEIEKEYEQKKLDIQKKYADTDMVINIAKTIAAGALAVMQAFAQLGPIGGAVSAALIGATTAAEVAVIVAQRNAIKNSSVNSGGSSSGSTTTGQRVITGYSTGGYTDSAASDHKAVGIVHANEWVAPAWMVRSNPVTFANLESYRKSGSHGRTGSAAKGFADGGYTGQQGGVEIYPADVEALVYAAISRAMADGTIRANVVYQDLKSKENQLGRFNAQTSRN